MILQLQEMMRQGKYPVVVHVIHQHKQQAVYVIQNVGELPDNLNIYQVKEAVVQRKTTCIQEGQRIIFVECIHKQTPLYIFGGGTIALPLSQMASMCGFAVHIFDERSAFAKKKRFPWAKEVHHKPFDIICQQYPFEEQAYYVLATQGHQKDEVCLCHILKKPYRYIGLVGSRRKSIMMKAQLIKHGFINEQLSDLHVPIGLPISASTPEEIAVSIIAELIQERAKYGEILCDESIWEVIQPPCIVVTILSHKGSTPRGMGSKMVIFQNGQISGSIGGGRIEYQAIEKAKELLESEEDNLVMDFNLAHSPGEDGMICGGSACVLLEKIS